MFVETVLPLGKADSGLKAADGALDIRQVAQDAALVESLGFDGLSVRDNKDDPYILSTLALQATTRLEVSTAVAIAFPRSPTVTAMTAWSLARLSGGRFTLGLGSQVKGHIERRFGMRWSAPGPWMRDYLRAVRDLWQAWQTETPVAHESEHYKINLNVPVFTPLPLENPAPKLHLAAVNPYMGQVAGELADGLCVHPVCTPHYLRTVMLPAVQRGAARAGRPVENFAIAVAPLVATGPDEETVLRKREEIRGRIAFYGSTPAYSATFLAHGLEALAADLNTLSRAQRWGEMAGLISDEVLDLYAIVASHDEIAARITERYAGLATRLEFSIPVATPADAERLRDIVQQLKHAGPGVD